MSKALMVDLETMATGPNATVLTLGAVHFNPHGMGYSDKLYMRINIEDQVNRDIDPVTLEWWAKQDPAIMDEAFSPDDRVPLIEAVDRFHKFAWGCSTFWSHGATFDLVILENLYRQVGKPLPWNFWQLRDTRTLFDLGFDPDMPQSGKHNALEDAIRQAVGVQNMYTKLGIRER